MGNDEGGGPTAGVAKLRPGVLSGRGAPRHPRARHNRDYAADDALFKN